MNRWILLYHTVFISWLGFRSFLSWLTTSFNWAAILLFCTDFFWWSSFMVKFFTKLWSVSKIMQISQFTSLNILCHTLQLSLKMIHFFNKGQIKCPWSAHSVHSCTLSAGEGGWVSYQIFRKEEAWQDFNF